MINATITPVHARPGNVVLVRDGQLIPLELSFEGVDHKGFGVWSICTRVRPTDEVAVTELGFNYIKADYENPDHV